MNKIIIILVIFICIAIFSNILTANTSTTLPTNPLLHSNAFFIDNLSNINSEPNTDNWKIFEQNYLLKDLYIQPGKYILKIEGTLKKYIYVQNNYSSIFYIKVLNSQTDIKFYSKTIEIVDTDTIKKFSINSEDKDNLTKNNIIEINNNSVIQVNLISKHSYIVLNECNFVFIES